MSAATYGSGDLHPSRGTRGTALQRPIQIFIIGGDFLLILLSYLIAGFLYSHLMASSALDQDVPIGAGLIVGALFGTIGHFNGIYDSHRLLDATWQVRKVAVTWLVSLTVLAVAAFLLKSTENLSRGTIILFAIIGLAILGAHRVAWRLSLASSFAKGHLIDRRVILLSLKSLDFTSNRLKDLRKNGFDVVRHIILSSTEDDAECDREIKNVICQARAIDAGEFLSGDRLERIAGAAEAKPAVARGSTTDPSAAGFSVADLVSRPFVPVGGTIAIEIQRPPLSILERAQKRCMDVGLASIGLLLLAPLLIAVSVLIKFNSEGSVIFRQSRRGFNGRPFEIWKFRTMSVSENGDTVTQATKEDARVTRIGRFLRNQHRTCRNSGTFCVAKCHWWVRDHTRSHMIIITIS